MRKSFVVLAAATFAWSSLALSQSGGAVVGTAPGRAAAAQTVKISATITAIDKAKRDVTLKGPQGNLLATGFQIRDNGKRILFGGTGRVLVNVERTK